MKIIKNSIIEQKKANNVMINHPINEKKKSNHLMVKQLKERLNATVKKAKQCKQQGNKVQAEAFMLEAFQLADQIIYLKNEILSQREKIAN
jgi:hypothetical protein